MIEWLQAVLSSLLVHYFYDVSHAQPCRASGHPKGRKHAGTLHTHGQMLGGVGGNSASSLND